MGKGKFRLVAAAVAVFGLILSSCFTIRSINVSPKALSPGGTAKVTVKLFRASTSTDSTTRVVLLIGLTDLDIGTVSQFDKKANFGGPLARVSDNPARDVMLGAGECVTSGVDASTIAASFDDWRAYRTVAEVNSAAAALNTPFTVSFNVDRAVGTANGGYGSYVVFSAAWIDDGDGVPESGEFICTSVVGGSVAFQP